MKVRCIDASDCDGTLTVGKVYEAYEYEAHGERRYRLAGDNGVMSTRYTDRFEIVTDEAEAPPEQPKVDPYEAHRVKWDELGSAARQMRGQDAISGAAARLHAGLQSEKVRERVKAFPKQGRNFELKGKR